MRASKAGFLGVAMLFGLTVLPLSPRVCLAQIHSFDQARDKLLADAFGGRAPAGEVFGDPRLLAGDVSVLTPGGAVRLGAGPGWVFFFRDRSRPRPLNELVLVRTTGTVTRKLVKGEPVSLRDFLPLAPLASGPEGSGSAVHSLEEAYGRLLAGLLGHTPGNRRVYALPGKREGRVAAENWQGVLTLGRGPGWVFFIDDNPAANWEHACRFALVTESGKILVVPSTTPPKDLSPFREMTEGMPAGGREAERSGTNAAGLPASHTVGSSLGHPAASTPAENRWAVILSGGYNQANNHIRYWNDCSYFYTTLTASGFLDGNIFVLISDGADPAVDRSDWTNSPTDLDGDGDADTQYSATRANITAVFDTLAGLLDGDDILYVFATDHGGSDDAAPYDDPAVKLYLWGESSITDAEFASEVDKVTTLATVCIFEQCYSGGMLDDLYGPNRVLLSAARYWELSYAMGPSYEYDEFSFHLTHALANPPAADASADGVVSLEEGYLYALARDTHQSELIDAFGDNLGEHPSYTSNPWDLGRRISLAGLAGEAAGPASGGYTQQEVADAYPTGGADAGWYGDNFLHEYALPFGFPCHGTLYHSVHVDANGLLHLVPPGASAWENSVDGLKGRTAIAPLWDDLTVYAEDGDAIYVEADASWVTIRWKAHTYADGRPVEAAVKLGASGDVRFLYGQGNDHTGRVAGRDKTIGISRGDGASYHLCLRNGEGNLQDAHAIQYAPAPPSWNPGALTPVLHLLLGP